MARKKKPIKAKLFSTFLILKGKMYVKETKKDRHAI